VKIILESVLKKTFRRAWTGLIWPRIDIKFLGFCGRDNEPLNSIKCVELLD
jgi:hypothetical protein